MKKLISLLIGVLVVGVWMAASISAPTAAFAVPTPTYDPRPLCSDRSGATTAIVRYEIPYGSVSSGGVYCRPLVQDSKYLVSSAQIGNQDLINLGIVQAVDVFAILSSGGTTTVFNNPINICLLGVGNLFFLDANQSPRPLIQLTVSSDGVYSCGTVSTAGTVALTTGGLAQPAAAPTAAGTPDPNATPGPTVTPGAALPVGSLANCSVTTTKIVRLRAEANTTSTILTRLPYNTTWKATERVEGWYRIVWKDTQGWVSSSFVRTAGSC